jgi:hypothetical protein
MKKTAANSAVSEPLVKIQATVAAELLKHFELSEDAEPFADRAAAPGRFIELMVSIGCFHDAVKFLAHGLPLREAVWWACLAARHALTVEKDSIHEAAVVAAETWATRPSEENRLLAKQLAEKTAFKTAASWAATSAWWSAGSMAEPGQPEVPPPPFLYAQAVASAICLAAVLPDPLNANQRYQRYLAQGLDLARGGRGEGAS